MAATRYIDFDLLLENIGGAYRSRVLDSPVGQAVADFSVPFGQPELDAFLLSIEQARDGEALAGASWLGEARRFGGRLFNAAFGGDVYSCFRSSLDAAVHDQAGLRVRLRLGGDGGLSRLPWEYLYYPALDRFLALSVETPLVRFLDLPARVAPLALKLPVRILAMIAAPTDYPELDVEQEWLRLKRAFAALEQRGVVLLERLEDAGMPALQQRLRRQDYHVLHFVGHGGFDEQTEEGVLIMEDESGLGVSVSGHSLGTLLHDHRSLSLALLNSCEGARTSQANHFAGTAQTLVRQGLPAVVAMQFEVTDTAALRFADVFYSALADRYPIDAAVAEARKAILVGGNDVEWGTPVLYMRAPDGIIWQVEQEAQMDDPKQKPWWEMLPQHTAGDVIIAEVGAGASGVAVGKGITQTIHSMLGKPTLDDNALIRQKLAELSATIQGLPKQLDPATAMMAEFQLKLLQGELTKTAEGDVPSASAIIQVGDWLLDSVPSIAEALVSLFATPAVGKIVGKAGDSAVQWVKERFSRSG